MHPNQSCTNYLQARWYKSFKTMAKIQLVFLAYSVFRARNRLSDRNKFKAELYKLFVKYARAVAFFTFASSVPWTVLCSFSQIPGFKIDARWKTSSAFAISCLGFYIEEPAKMATYMGFYLPKVLETVYNLFRTDSYSSRFIGSSALWLFLSGAILGLTS